MKVAYKLIDGCHGKNINKWHWIPIMENFKSILKTKYCKKKVLYQTEFIAIHLKIAFAKRNAKTMSRTDFSINSYKFIKILIVNKMCWRKQICAKKMWFEKLELVYDLALFLQNKIRGSYIFIRFCCLFVLLFVLKNKQ